MTFMSTIATPQTKSEIVYPDSDDEPMAENTKQFRYIVTIQGGLDALLPNVFVAGDLFWYPVEGEPTIRTAPDVLVAFGRPKGDRPSYKQWEENHIAPQVTFEVLSPGNRAGAMTERLRFYERYGVEEYCIYDPDSGDLNGWIRKGDRFEAIPEMIGWVSKRLGIRFDVVDGELKLYGPDNQPFVCYVELAERMEKERQEKEAQRLAKERQRQEKEKERQRAERLAAQLRALGIEPEA
jgi:Uma2 family endonuclease